MPFQITPEHVNRLSLHRRKRSGSDMAKSVKQTAEVVAAAGGLAYLQGSSKDNSVPEIMGAPIDLVAGIALHVAGFSGYLGKWADDAHNLGDGALAFYVANWAHGYGQKHPRNAGMGQMTGWKRPAQMGVGAPQPLTQQHLQHMAGWNLR